MLICGKTRKEKGKRGIVFRFVLLKSILGIFFVVSFERGR